jgi:pilus assembly protein Flp/PilA
MKNPSAVLSLLLNDDRGQGLVEYALIFVLIVIVAIVALIFLGTQLSSIVTDIGNSV